MLVVISAVRSVMHMTTSRMPYNPEQTMNREVLPGE